MTSPKSAYAHALQTRAVVAHPPKGGERQWAMEEIEIPPLENDRVLVEMVASGICHTDLVCGSLPDGTAPFPLPPYPRVLGHEGSGLVRAVGSSVKSVKPGARVVLSFVHCNKCHNCQNGAPGYCAEFTALNFAGEVRAFRKADGQDVGGCFFGQSSFAQLVSARESSIVDVSDVVGDGEGDLKLFASLGCGIQTGAGTITELAGAGPSDKVAILGLGGVGLAAIMAAKLQGCHTIIAIDRVPARIELAMNLGATHGIDTSQWGKKPTEINGTNGQAATAATKHNSLVSAVLQMTEGTGTTVTVDATGVVAMMQQGLEITANQGKMILVGVAPADAALTLPVVPFMVSGKQLLGSMEGAVRPREYIPRIIQWYKEGTFPLDKLIRQYKVDDFETAVHDMEKGDVIKPVLTW